MPKKMLWTELLFSYFPIDKKRFGQQMLARFLLLFSIWLTGFLPYAFDGLLMSYLSNSNIYQNLFGTSFLILFGSYMVQRSLDGIIPKARPILKLSDSQFLKFSERIKRYSYSFFPSLLIALGFIVLSGVPNQFQQALTEGFQAHVIWHLSFAFFLYLLIGTAFWMFASIWLTIFLISRQPLNVELSAKTNEAFHDLSMLALMFSLFYFLAVSLQILSVPFSPLEFLLSPNTFLIAIGIIGILFPFYNIHIALLKLKKQRLERIEEESEKLSQQIDDLLAKQPSREFSDQTIAKMARLFSLQVKERRIKAAQEWPIDVGFLSKLAGLVLLPILGRILIEIFVRYF